MGRRRRPPPAARAQRRPPRRGVRRLDPRRPATPGFAMGFALGAEQRDRVRHVRVAALRRARAAGPARALRPVRRLGERDLDDRRPRRRARRRRLLHGRRLHARRRGQRRRRRRPRPAGARAARPAPLARRRGDEDDADEDDTVGAGAATWPGSARACARRAAARRSRGATIVSALVIGLAAYDEYVPLLAEEHGSPVATAPLVLALVVAGQIVGTALAGRTAAMTPRTVGVVVALAAILQSRRQRGSVAGSASALLAVGFGMLNNAMVVSEARLQSVISGRARATVTSTASLATEVVAPGRLRRVRARRRGVVDRGAGRGRSGSRRSAPRSPPSACCQPGRPSSDGDGEALGGGEHVDAHRRPAGRASAASRSSSSSSRSGSWWNSARRRAPDLRRQPHGVLDGAVAPRALRGELRRRVLGVVDQQVDAAHSSRTRSSTSQRVARLLVVADVGDAGAPVGHAVAVRLADVGHRPRLDVEAADVERAPARRGSSIWPGKSCSPIGNSGGQIVSCEHRRPTAGRSTATACR